MEGTKEHAYTRPGSVGAARHAARPGVRARNATVGMRCGIVVITQLTRGAGVVWTPAHNVLGVAILDAVCIHWSNGTFEAFHPDHILAGIKTTD